MTIKAIRTTYKGIEFRSRTEALMGLPDGWTDSGPVAIADYTHWEMQSCHLVRQLLLPRSTGVFWDAGPGRMSQHEPE